MSTVQALYGFLLASSLFLAAFTPGRARDEVVIAAMAVTASWALCMWAYMPVTPAQVLADWTGLRSDPFKIWATQDCIISCLLAHRYALNKNTVVKTVGILFGAQIGLHLLHDLGMSTGSYLHWLDWLFLCQLASISWFGGGYVFDYLRDRLRRRLDARRARRPAQAAKA